MEPASGRARRTCARRPPRILGGCSASHSAARCSLGRTRQADSPRVALRPTAGSQGAPRPRFQQAAWISAGGAPGFWLVPLPPSRSLHSPPRVSPRGKRAHDRDRDHCPPSPASAGTYGRAAPAPARPLRRTSSPCIRRRSRSRCLASLGPRRKAKAAALPRLRFSEFVPSAGAPRRLLSRARRSARAGSHSRRRFSIAPAEFSGRAQGRFLDWQRTPKKERERLPALRQAFRSRPEEERVLLEDRWTFVHDFSGDQRAGLRRLAAAWTTSMRVPTSASRRRSG